MEEDTTRDRDTYYNEEYGCRVVKESIVRFTEVDLAQDNSTDTDTAREAVYKEIERCVANSIPFVVTGTVQLWPAFTKWLQPDYLLNKVGPNTKIPVRTKFGSDNPEEWYGETADITFAEFMDHWTQNKEWSEEMDKTDTFYYLASLPMNRYFPELMQDINVPFYPKRQKKAGNLWLGNKGQITSVHYDFSTGDPGMDGLHAVIMGRKKFLLFDPQVNQTCFTRRKVWGRFHNAEIDRRGLPDPCKHPEFANAVCHEIFLSAGDILFIPKLWWHHVTTLEPSISVNFWFQHLGSEMLKLTKHWGHLEEYLMAVEQMHITPEKMKNVLQFYGLKVSEKDVQYYMTNVHEFMLLPQFIETFSNGTKAPWIRGQEAQSFALQIQEKVRNWVLSRKSATVDLSNK